jgi:hypothetical protein
VPNGTLFDIIINQGKQKIKSFNKKYFFDDLFFSEKG